MTDKFKSRKFIVALLSIMSCTGLMYMSKISDGVYSTIMVATIGAYLAANVLQKEKQNAN
jgi:hypothetical protein